MGLIFDSISLSLIIDFKYIRHSAGFCGDASTLIMTCNNFTKNVFNYDESNHSFLEVEDFYLIYRGYRIWLSSHYFQCDPYPFSRLSNKYYKLYKKSHKPDCGSKYDIYFLCTFCYYLKNEYPRMNKSCDRLAGKLLDGIEDYLNSLMASK